TLARQIGHDLLREGRGHRAGFFSSRFWSEQMMGWAMKDPAFKTQLLRFVDVFPMLRTSAQVYEYLGEYLGSPGVGAPPWIELGLKAGRFAKGVFAAGVGAQIAALAGHFIAGADAPSALPRLHDLWLDGSAFTVALLGEMCLSDEEAQAYQRRYLDLVTTLPDEVGRWPAHPTAERDHLGPVPRANVSVKPSALAARADAIDFEGSIRSLHEALRPLLDAAARRRVLVHFDMEQHALKDLTIELFQRCCEEIDFPAGLALQAYLQSGLDDARRIVAWTQRTGRQVTVRLVKGAYWDYEVIHAERMGWPVPVWTDKRQTDACFERMTEVLLAAAPRRPGEGGVKLAIGSHNVRSIAYALALANRLGLPDQAIEIQMLYGMADQLKAAVVGRGLRLRQYVPLGELLPGMAYLVRRLLENTSNQSWLRAGYFEDAPEDTLLAPPVPPATGPQTAGGQARRHELSPAIEGLGEGLPFFNEPARDFADAEQRSRFAAAVWASG
ncbi:MAG: proline dehydrogenase family protein, partial [Thermoguttaceae bacterium]|nr:proline dehydrogenase family protein [Thermoguttaceae bacterium]